MDLFYLQRLEDETGISGVGIVAEGVRFSSGKCVLTWLTEFSSIAIYDNIDLIDKIHGHAGKTVIVWGDRTNNEMSMNETRVDD